MRSRLPVCRPNVNLHIKSIFAAQTHFSCPKRLYSRGAASHTMQGLLQGKPTMCGPEMSEGPVRRDANDVRPRKYRRAYCQGNIRCAVQKNPKGLFAGTSSRCGPANSAAPVAQNIALLALVCVWLTDMLCVLRN